MEKSTIRILGVVSGAFFIIGGLLLAFLIKSLSSIIVGLGGTASGTANAELLLGGVGSAVGIVIIILSVTLVMSQTRSLRIISGIVIIALGLFGSIYTIGGLVIGIILALIAGITAIVHKDAVQSTEEPAFLQN